LFPQSRLNLQLKNTLERRLKGTVCSGHRKLRPIQRAIARNWVALYRLAFGTNPQ